MMNAEKGSEDVILLDEHQCYWTYIERESPLTGNPNKPVARLELDEVFERDVPEPFSGLAVRYAAVSDRAVIGCAIASERVRGVLDLQEHVIVLRPRALPGALMQRVDSDSEKQRLALQLNFLEDEFEPLPVVRLRHRTRRIAIAGVAVSLLLIAGGFWFRAQAASDEASRLAARTRAMLSGELPSGAQATTSADPARQLGQELAFLRQTRGAAAVRLRPRDAASGLEALLAAWPSDTETRTNSLQVSADQITLGVEVPSIVAAEELALALGSVRGWTLQKPQTEVVGGVVKVVAILRLPQSDAADAHGGGRQR